MLTIIILIFVAAGIYFGNKYYTIAKIGAGYSAKILCSEIFIAGRNEQDIIKNDLNIPALDYFNISVDYKSKSVTSSVLFGIISKTCRYYENFGSVLGSTGVFEDGKNIKRRNEVNHYKLASYTNTPENINNTQFENIIKNAFEEGELSGSKQTRAIIVLYKGKIAAEQYAPGFTDSTKFCGWSMSKTVMNALYGVAVKKGLIALNAPVKMRFKVPEQDQNNYIMYDDLLRMVSGLEFQESYKHYNSDALKMLYDSDDMAQFAADKNRTAEPGEVWNYSSGTTNILSKCLRNEFGNDSLYWNFPYDELFDKIGMNSAIFEVDASGTFIGSTSVYVTARDWAKFGLLYAQKGVWNGENIFDEDWLFYSATPTMNSRQRKFGAHLWIKPLDPKVDQKIIINKLPDDYCYASGHYGQYLSVIPSEELVVVRLGFTKNSHDWNQEKFVADILSTINKN